MPPGLVLGIKGVKLGPRCWLFCDHTLCDSCTDVLKSRGPFQSTQGIRILHAPCQWFCWHQHFDQLNGLSPKQNCCCGSHCCLDSIGVGCVRSDGNMSKWSVSLNPKRLDGSGNMSFLKQDDRSWSKLDYGTTCKEVTGLHTNFEYLQSAQVWLKIQEWLRWI